MQQPFFTGLKFALSCAIIKKKARSDTVKRLMYAAPKYLAVIAACVAAFFIQQAFAFVTSHLPKNIWAVSRFCYYE